MRTRHSTGGVRKQRGKWIGHWYSEGKRKSQVVGSAREMTKGKAREEVAKIVAAERTKPESSRSWAFGEFVEQVYLPFYSRKWKHSTRGSSDNRIALHLVAFFRDRELSSFSRDELQDSLDLKASQFSFSTVDHLRWDLKAIFDSGGGRRQFAAQPRVAAIHAQSCCKAEMAGDDD